MLGQITDNSGLIHQTQLERNKSEPGVFAPEYSRYKRLDGPLGQGPQLLLKRLIENLAPNPHSSDQELFPIFQHKTPPIDSLRTHTWSILLLAIFGLTALPLAKRR